MRRIILTGGGTLGSVSPLIAIKESLLDTDYLFIGTQDGPESRFVREHGIRFRTIGSSKFRRYVSIMNLVDAMKLPFIIFQAWIIIRQYRPHLILSSGGFVAVPVALAGRLCGVPIYMHQQDLRIGLANRIIQYFASVVTTTFPDQTALFPHSNVYCTGNPVRPLKDTDQPKKDLILILGGSQGARGLNTMVNAVIPEFSKKHEIIHVLGGKNFYQRLSLPVNYTPVKFLAGDYGKFLSQAKVIITRPGMATLTELAYYSKAAIVIPMPGTHQVDNAKYFQNKSAARYIAQSDGEGLRESLRLLMTDSESREDLGTKLNALFPANANKNYIDCILANEKKINEVKPAVYFIGIGGIGISALVPYFEKKGFVVMGSDISHNEVTRRLEERGVQIYFRHDKRNLPLNTKLVLYSTAVPLSNEELIEAKKRHIDIYSYKEYLGRITEEYTTIAISGTHGKTTTTALTGYVLKDTAFDPTVIVGSFISQLGNSNFYSGTSSYCVVEADEYRSDMLLLHPTIAVLTNIDIDHMDFYRDLTDIQDHFQEFAEKIPSNGVLIKNFDDDNLRRISSKKNITFGFGLGADYQAGSVTISPGVQSFDVVHKSKVLERFTISLPGRFNIANALAAITVAHTLGLEIKIIKKRVADFTGSWRRYEKIGEYHGSPVYSDYAHHPTAVRATIQAFKDFYPSKKIFIVYQPHSFDRTAKLFKEFSTAFDGANTLILTEVYDVAGRDLVRAVSSKDLLQDTRHPDAHFAKSQNDLQSLIDTHLTQNSILVIMGAGDIDNFGRNLVQKK